MTDDTPKDPGQSPDAASEQPAQSTPSRDAGQDSQTEPTAAESAAGDGQPERASDPAAPPQAPVEGPAAEPLASTPAAPAAPIEHTSTEQVPAEQRATQQYPVQPNAQPGDNPAAYPQTDQQQGATPPQAATQPTEPLPPQALQNPYAQQQAAYRYGDPRNAYGQQPSHYQYGAPPQAQQPSATPQAGAQGAAFGQAAYAGQQQYAQHPGQHTAQQPPQRGGQDQKPAKQKDGKGSRAGLLITGFVLAGLIGGGVGAGVVGLYAVNSGNSKSVTSTGATSVTVNDPQTATNVTAVASKVSPSVVTINVSGGQEAGTGSGIVLSADGYVLTNTHVVTLDGETGSPTVTVTTNDGKIYKAKVVGTDPVLDLAVIKLQDASGLAAATFGDSDKVNVGDSTIAIGAPLGLSGTVTNGIVSSLNRSIQIASSAAPDQDQQDNGDNNGDSPFNFWNFDQNGGGKTSSQSTISLPVIQTDAAINPGNSGGPLLNGKGEVMGINVAIASAGSSDSSSGQTGSIGVGFAVPSNVAHRVADEIVKNGKATSGLLGATVADAASSSDATTVGALVKSVTSGGAAESAGLKAGDVVTNFNGKPITNATDLTAQVRALAGGSKADITYQRDGSTKQSSVTLGTLTQ